MAGSCEVNLRKGMAYYDDFDYQSYWVGREYEDQAEKIAVGRLLKQIPQKNSLVDVGAGFGRFVDVYAPRFDESWLVEPCEDLLNQAKLTGKSFKNLVFRIGEAEKLPIDSRTMDVVLMIRIAHHLKEPEKAFLEAHRVLRTGGFLILEFANKVHFRARLRAVVGGSLSFGRDRTPKEQRSQENIGAGKIDFLNHHPRQIKKDLEKFGFVVMGFLSVSNFRSPIVKKFFPSPLLLFLEKHLQKPLAKIFFGPSIFVLAKKT